VGNESWGEGDTAAAAGVNGDGTSAFDFETHRKNAEESYGRMRGTYADMALTVGNLLEKALSAHSITVHSIEKRAKEVDSFGRKAVRALEEDAERPKYSDPMSQITDLAGCRVITFFLKNVEEVGQIIGAQFFVQEKANRSAFLRGEERLGYESVHYIVQLKEDRLQLPEYAPFRGLCAEIQVRTILQHAWAEIEHDIQYKSVDVLPATIRRRFLALAGMIEIGDREFQAIFDSHNELRVEARKSIDEGRLKDVELTPDSLQNYLDRRFGPDMRMRDISYAWQVKTLRNMGFENLAQLDECLSGYDDDAVSRALWGRRQGQLTRLDDTVMASMGENFIRRHHWAEDPETADWFEPSVRRRHDLLKAAGIPVGSYAPKSE